MAGWHGTESVTPEILEGYDIARDMYGDGYADYLAEHDSELLAKGRTIRPWPASLADNDGD